SVTVPRPVVMHISNFRPIKDPCGVVHIFSRLRMTLNAELWFVGDGEEMEKVKALVGEEGLTGDVRFFGLLPDISRVVSRADLLIMSSTYESFCLTALEAMACGVPVLAPRVGGIPEVVRDGKTGFLYPPGDYPAAAEFAVSLLSKPGLYAQMSEEAAHRAQRFGQERVIALYEGLYSRVMAKSSFIEKTAPSAEEAAIHGADH
ncbi:MAG: glycosyltransferase, partial [Deltaproteobacteria bacterium]|nr:glycosyltransferase [Deltaproteobacteria bacterium]